MKKAQTWATRRGQGEVGKANEVENETTDEERRGEGGWMMMGTQPRVLLAASGVVVVGRDGDEVDRRVVEPVPEAVARHEEAVRVRHEMEVKPVLCQ
jgi:hypothetical protein